MHSLLDMAKIADSLLFVLDAAEGWDDYGDYCLSCLFAQGLPSHGGYNLACNLLPSFGPQYKDVWGYSLSVLILHSTGVSWCV